MSILFVPLHLIALLIHGDEWADSFTGDLIELYELFKERQGGFRAVLWISKQMLYLIMSSVAAALKSPWGVAGSCLGLLSMSSAWLRTTGPVSWVMPGARAAAAIFLTLCCSNVMERPIPRPPDGIRVSSQAALKTDHTNVGGGRSRATLDGTDDLGQIVDVPTEGSTTHLSVPFASANPKLFSAELNEQMAEAANDGQEKHLARTLAERNHFNAPQPRRRGIKKTGRQNLRAPSGVSLAYAATLKSRYLNAVARADSDSDFHAFEAYLHSTARVASSISSRNMPVTCDRGDGTCSPDKRWQNDPDGRDVRTSPEPLDVSGGGSTGATGITPSVEDGTLATAEQGYGSETHYSGHKRRTLLRCGKRVVTTVWRALSYTQ